jgi:hypothetical protein
MSQRRDPGAGLRFNRGPKRAIPGEAGPDALRDGIALCLSGGGYPAMLFHLGGLWRLNELGLLPELDRVSAVSGGALTASALAVAWGELDFGDAGVARALPPGSWGRCARWPRARWTAARSCSACCSLAAPTAALPPRTGATCWAAACSPTCRSGPSSCSPLPTC